MTEGSECRQRGVKLASLFFGASRMKTASTRQEVGKDENQQEAKTSSPVLRGPPQAADASGSTGSAAPLAKSHRRDHIDRLTVYKCAHNQRCEFIALGSLWMPLISSRQHMASWPPGLHMQTQASFTLSTIPTWHWHRAGASGRKHKSHPSCSFHLPAFMRILTVCEMLVLLVPCHTRIILARLLPETSVSSVGSHTSGTDGCIRM